MDATDVLRSLVKEIVLTPDPQSGELQIEVHGDLAGILTIALERKKPADRAGGSQVEMVAGTCSNQKLRTQKSRPDGAAGVRDTGSQFEMVAGASNHLKLRLLFAYRAILEQSALATSSGLLRSAA